MGDEERNRALTPATDLSRLEPLDEPTPVRFKAARDLFRAAVREYRAETRLTPKACALAAEAILREPRAVGFVELFDKMHEDYKGKGGAFATLAPYSKTLDQPPPLGGDEASASTLELLHAAVIVACCAKAFINLVRSSGLAERERESTSAGIAHCEELDRRGSVRATQLCPSDPRVWRLLASFHMARGEAQPAADALAASIAAARALPAADPRRDNWFTALYSLGTLNDVLAGPELGEKRRLLAESVELIDEFLEAAPACHYFYPGACFWRSIHTILLRADALGSSAVDLAARFPEDTAASARLFARGQRALAFQRAHFPLQPTSQYEVDAYTMQRQFAHCGVVEGVPRVPHKCWGLGCNGFGLSSCSRCREASYCGPACQRRHWKAEHKAECQAVVAGAPES